jgi:nucleotidyltransferase/DNA polymerase involved in DNA repair
MLKTSAIFLVDMQSFYASVEKADQPELKEKPLVVAGDPERRSGIVLAACPLAKKYGVSTAEAVWQAEQKCPQLVVVRPRMQRYLDVSLQITLILEQFTDLVEVFSVDEQFMDVTGSIKLFGDPWSIARKVQKAIMDETKGVYARVGIGPNKVLAKIACDNFAKKNREGIFELNFSNIKQTMWPLPVGKMFGIGRRMERHLSNMGIREIGHLANFSVEGLKRKWGVNGQVIWQMANGMDSSPVTPHTHEKQKNIGHQMTLPRDYEHQQEIDVILLELSEEVCMRSREKGYRGWVVAVGCSGADFNIPTGFYRQRKLFEPTNITKEVYGEARQLFYQFWDGLPVRRLGITLAELESDEVYQLSLFSQRERMMNLEKAMDGIKRKYGKSAIVRAASLTYAGQAVERAVKIGGHYK